MMILIMISMIGMIAMMTNNDDDNYNANDDQTKTTFQTMHFREPLISKKPRFLAFTHVWVYSYIIRLQYNQPIMLL